MAGGARVVTPLMMPESHSIALALAHRFVSYENQIETVAAKLRTHKNILDLCPLPMFLTDEDGKCVYVNNAMCRITGVKLEDLQYDFWIDYVYADDRLETVASWNDFVKNPGVTTYEHQHRYIRPDSTVINVLVKAKQMPCKAIVGFAIPTADFNFADWLRGANLDSLPPIPPS